MARLLDVQQFVKDYCVPLPDKDLIVKHKISAKELVPLVRKLMTEGYITREHHRERTRKMKEMESAQEKSFLKSLYHCPVCSHVHPTPFRRCPACGADVSKPKEKAEAKRDPLLLRVEQGRTPAAQSPVAQKPAATAAVRPQAQKAGPLEPSRRPRQPQSVPTPRAASDATREDFPPELRAKVGNVLQNVVQFRQLPSGTTLEGYKLTTIVADTARAATFKAENPSGYGPVLVAKLFHKQIADKANIDEVLEKIVEFQSNMDNPNIVRLIGAGTINSEKLLVYEFLPLDLETLIQTQPDGMPEAMINRLLPQILNGLGYAHMHLGKDQVTRRLPHLSIKASKMLVDANKEIAKLDDCGVSKAIFEVRGYKQYLYEEPGADWGTLPPEAFVIKSRIVKPMPADIYALGVVLYRMATGKPPFEGSSLEEFKFAHLKKYATPPKVHRYDVPLWMDEMILKCLEKEPEKRWRSPTQMELSIGKQLKSK